MYICYTHEKTITLNNIIILIRLNAIFYMHLHFIVGVLEYWNPWNMEINKIDILGID